MKALDGRLPLDTRYKVIEYDYSTIENATICQNCGKIIANTATVEDLQGHRFIIGQDCAEKIITCDNSEYWHLQQVKKEFNRKRALVAKMRKLQKTNQVKIQGDWLVFYGDDGIWSSRLQLWHVKPIAEQFNFDLTTIEIKA